MNKRLIIILSLTVIFLLLVTYILLSRNSTLQPGNTSPTPAQGLEDVVPGIIIPTTDIKPGELDVVAVSPSDMSTNLTTTVPIEIEFSQPVKENEVEFMISPEISFSENIVENKLIITPNEDFQTSTLYTYRVKIMNNLQKIRMYTFSTAGEGAIKRPDTSPNEEEINKYNESLRIEYPDIYVQNNTPYENAEFGITGTFSETTNKFQFRVLLKRENKNDARDAFIIWLQSLDLTDEQIASLDITYE